jgi:hypothetical protein
MIEYNVAYKLFVRVIAMNQLSAQMYNIIAVVSGVIIPLISAVIIIMSRRKRIAEYGSLVR